MAYRFFGGGGEAEALRLGNRLPQHGGALCCVQVARAVKIGLKASDLGSFGSSMTRPLKRPKGPCRFSTVPSLAKHMRATPIANSPRLLFLLLGIPPPLRQHIERRRAVERIG